MIAVNGHDSTLDDTVSGGGTEGPAVAEAPLKREDPNPMAATLLFVLFLTVVLAAAGRAAIPRTERLPLRAWKGSDLLANIVHGLRVVSSLNEAQLRAWEAYSAALQPWHRRKQR